KIEPLNGHSSSYLSDLAYEMFIKTDVTIDEKEAMPVLLSTSERLKKDGQIRNLPEPRLVLNALYSHHILERYDSKYVRFQHQQFQEFFAKEKLKAKLFVLVKNKNQEEVDAFIRLYVNKLIWTESLMLIAEEIANSTESNYMEVGKLLVDMALRVDPIFASELAYQCGPLVWTKIKTALSNSLRNLYKETDPSYRQYALAGMLATGSSDFSDIIIPLLSSSDLQERLNTYRLYDNFHLSSLGNGWPIVVKNWSEEARNDFVVELLQNVWNQEIIDNFVFKDQSVSVRAAGVLVLTWVGSQEETSHLLETIDSEAFKKVINRIPSSDIPPLIRPKALKVFQKLYLESQDSISCLFGLVRASELGDSDLIDLVKNKLNSLKRDELKSYEGKLEAAITKSAIDIVQKTDSEWVSNWVAERMIDGSLWYKNWNNFITTVSNDIKNNCLDILLKKELAPYSPIISILATTADQPFAERVFSKLCDIRRKIALSATTQQKDYSILKQVEELYRSFPYNIAVAGLLNYFSKPFDEVVFSTIVTIFSSVARSEPKFQEELDKDLRQKIIEYLKNAESFVQEADDFNGVLKANFAST
ncbi:MAG: hypothetical protein WCQ47_09020, partial [bacterium]